ncbi:MAG: nitrous oxide reductase accessory protein NosL [Bacteroidetes bacterium]|nr:nitrous oxide reductase accessory protein NosL [Bacteroidota bacterium]
MDKKFGAELVNKKGKVQKFDSGECMMNYLKIDAAYQAGHFLIINYESPGELLNAETAVYLQGGQVRSPMGGKLAAFASKQGAEKFQVEMQGEILSWEEVKRLDF